MKTELENVLPQDIEKRSFEIITEELGEVSLIPGTEPIVKRCIHTSKILSMQRVWKFSKTQFKGQWMQSVTERGS